MDIGRHVDAAIFPNQSNEHSAESGSPTHESATVGTGALAVIRQASELAEDKKVQTFIRRSAKVIGCVATTVGLIVLNSAHFVTFKSLGCIGVWILSPIRSFLKSKKMAGFYAKAMSNKWFASRVESASRSRNKSLVLQAKTPKPWAEDNFVETCGCFLVICVPGGYEEFQKQVKDIIERKWTFLRKTKQSVNKKAVRVITLAMIAYAAVKSAAIPVLIVLIMGIGWIVIAHGTLRDRGYIEQLITAGALWSVLEVWVRIRRLKKPT